MPVSQKTKIASPKAGGNQEVRGGFEPPLTVLQTVD